MSTREKQILPRALEIQKRILGVIMHFSGGKKVPHITIKNIVFLLWKHDFKK